MTNHHPVKSLAEDDRPREKMISKGRSALSDAELIAILLNTGTTSNSAIELARILLQSANNDLQDLSRYDVADFKKIKGIGDAKAVTLLAAIELGRRRERFPKNQQPKITSSADVYKVMKPRLADLSHEEFFTIGLSRSNHVISVRQTSVGGTSGTIADGKVIFKHALNDKACALILVHNHPSGQTKPSQSDIALTEKLSRFGKYIDLPVLDHLIFCDNGYFSFADEGMIS
ncbi:MAG: repair protein RadC [Bacteroidota bacterium]|jgi:DNA repair protein RadC